MNIINFISTYAGLIAVVSGIIGILGTILAIRLQHPTRSDIARMIVPTILIVVALLVVAGGIEYLSNGGGGVLRILMIATPTPSTSTPPSVVPTHPHPTSTTSSVQPTHPHSTATSIPTPIGPTPVVSTPTAAAANVTYAFDFETGTQNWGTSEGAYKPATVAVTTNPVHSGSHALQVTTTLLGSQNPAYTGNDVYRHTEATVYFNSAIPKGFITAGPYNLNGKQVSCFVYLPSALANQQTYIRIFVKDTNYANDFSLQVNIDSSNVGRWIQLSLVVGNDSNSDPAFDPMHVNAIGIRIETADGSSLNNTGSLYIDDCIIPHP